MSVLLKRKEIKKSEKNAKIILPKRVKKTFLKLIKNIKMTTCCILLMHSISEWMTGLIYIP